MKPTIGLVLPSMRAYKINQVIEDLCNQTVPPDRVVIVDNGCDIDDFDIRLMLKGFRLICPGRNTGCNFVWNMMWDLDTDLVGAVADDLRLSPHLIEVLSEALELKFGKNPTGATTATILQDKGYSDLTKDRPATITGRSVWAKGACGAFLMRSRTLNCIPPIPDVFFNFFGDNYLAYWFGILELDFIAVNIHVAHGRHTNKESLEGKRESVERERGNWKSYIRGEFEFSP